jgi:hypothetical protein
MYVSLEKESCYSVQDGLLSAGMMGVCDHIELSNSIFYFIGVTGI